ncbi:GNAT family N-acetyltransferase [Pseudonocardia sp. CA-107938]|uniref:GNAT family N-acetyltransferase n=1 Tax=Pseudonocardia sp. CA-107938 TaxID=3240021 RepID=UPI003D935E5A
MTDPWPLHGLVLRTPRLELRPDDDEGLYALAALADLGVHAEAEMPFVQPWTRSADRGRAVLQYQWRCRAEVTPESWTVNFLVRVNGEVVGTQGLSARSFAVLKEVRTGSWLGLAHQGRGYGTQMRAAVLAFAFDYLGARTARSTAFADNARSHGVSRRLGYRVDGTELVVREGAATTDVRLLVDPDTFVRPDWKLQVEGLEPVRDLLGAT